MIGDNIFYISGIIGLALIIFGTLLLTLKNKKKKTIFTFLFLGGIFLEIYSIYIQDTIFIILQGFYILVTIYGLIKLNKFFATSGGGNLRSCPTAKKGKVKRRKP